MADFYIDTVAGSSANNGSSINTPKQFISQATMSSGNRIFLKRGQLHPISNYRFFANSMYLGDYGTGTRPILQKTAGPDAWIYLKDCANVKIENIILDCNGFTGPGLACAPGNSQSVADCIFKNVSIRNSPNSVGWYLTPTGTGTNRRLTLINCDARNCYSHGFYVGGDSDTVIHINCVSDSNGWGTGAHGFTAYVVSGTGPNRTTWINCVATQTFDTNGIEGQGFQSDDNSTNTRAIGCIAVNNRGYGFLANNATNFFVSGCIAINNDGPGFGCTNASSGSKFLNNTGIKNNVTKFGSLAGEINITGTSTGATINNNLLIAGKATIGVVVGSGSTSGSTGVNNCVYGYGSNSTGITISSSVTSDPLLSGNYTLRTGSPCIGAGIPLNGTIIKDFHGKSVLKALPDIGALQVE